MNRTTKHDVDVMFYRAERAAQSVGIDTDGWTVEAGSQTYGRAWRLYRRDDTTGGLSNAVGGESYIGWSAREAAQTLGAMARAWEEIGRFHE